MAGVGFGRLLFHQGRGDFWCARTYTLSYSWLVDLFHFFKVVLTTYSACISLPFTTFHFIKSTLHLLVDRGLFALLCFIVYRLHPHSLPNYKESQRWSVLVSLYYCIATLCQRSNLLASVESHAYTREFCVFPLVSTLPVEHSGCSAILRSYPSLPSDSFVCQSILMFMANSCFVTLYSTNIYLVQYTV